MDIISTKEIATVLPYLRAFHLPNTLSHKGQNGKVLVVGGSSLFHGAVLWAAEAASLLVDMTHVASTEENNEIIRTLKIKWQGGIVVPQTDIPFYADEDDVVLVGNGMMREGKIQIQNQNSNSNSNPDNKTWEKILEIQNEGEFTRECVHYLMEHYPHKQFVFDAGALQMMDKEWLCLLQKPALLTPHQEEFHRLFGTDVRKMPLEEKAQAANEVARKYHSVILMKAVDDIITNGSKTVIVRGGNAGLTKGGTGDLLAGITSGFIARTDPFSSAVLASYLLKITADNLFAIKGYWYSIHNLLQAFPEALASLTRER